MGTPVSEQNLTNIALSLLPGAFGSMYETALYALASGHPQAELALDLQAEQDELLARLAVHPAAPGGADLSELRAFFDAHAERLAGEQPSPALARYGAIHARRIEFLPPLQ